VVRVKQRRKENKRMIGRLKRLGRTVYCGLKHKEEARNVRKVLKTGFRSRE
jgi:hypothetical protein